MKSGYFFPRELSLLSFHSRVLSEADYPANPLLEKLKFIAIFSGNIDEFFMVRVAGLRRQSKEGDMPDPSGMRPSAQLEEIRRRMEKLLRTQHELLYRRILPEMEREGGVFLRRVAELAPGQVRNLQKIFESSVLPVLTPLAIDEAHPFPLLGNGAIEIAVSLRSGKKCGKFSAAVPEAFSGEDGKLRHVLIEVPEVLPRFAEISSAEGRIFVPMEDVVSSFMQQLFGDLQIVESLPFRVTRDMDFAMDSEVENDLMAAIERKILQRNFRDVIRLEINAADSRSELAGWLEERFQLEDMFVYHIRGMLNLKHCFELAGKCARPEWLEEPWPGMPVFHEGGGAGIFDEIKKRRYILNAPPFQNFGAVVDFLNAAAEDPDVLAVKQTLYRVSGNSPVVNALLKAAKNGKQVTVVVELKARFDEYNNINWARKLEEFGAHVVYGITGLKIHGKALLVVRREEEGIHRYVHLATGNYNDKTAQIYTDMGMLTDDGDIAFDVANIFNMITGCSAPPEEWRKIAAAPFDLREKFLYLINREAEFASRGCGGRIIAKMNGFSDDKMVEAMQNAAAAGVKIDLIVRGICCFRPQKGMKNVRIISIVDRYLEHSRIFYFGNGGRGEYYLSSADWMLRNLDRRIELLFPVEDEAVQAVLGEVLRFQLEDHEKGRVLQSDGRYFVRRNSGEHTPERSQERTYRYFRSLYEKEKKMRQSMDVLPVKHGAEQ